MKTIIIIIFVFTALNLFSQENLFETIKENEAKCTSTGFYQCIDTILFKEVAKDYLKKYLVIKEKHNYFWETVEPADTNNFKIILPILHLKEATDSTWNYQALYPYIEKEFSPYDQSVFIEIKGEMYIFSILKRTYEKYILRSLNPEILMSITDKDVIGMSRKNPNLGNRSYLKADKHIYYKQIKKYTDQNPQTVLFSIDRLTGIWGINNNKLIKLKFTRNDVEEVDGEKYFREELFPLSPMGIKRILEGEQFFVIITG